MTVSELRCLLERCEGEGLGDQPVYVPTEAEGHDGLAFGVLAYADGVVLDYTAEPRGRVEYRTDEAGEPLTLA